MGWWQGGYIEFHELADEEIRVPVARAPKYQCPRCRLAFSSEQDLRIHQFEGHSDTRPVLVFRGRECGRSRLVISTQTSPSDWVIRSATSATINGKSMTTKRASEILSTQRSGVVDVMLANGSVQQPFQFEFALATEDDLEGVDSALAHFISSRELSHGAIDSFIMRSKPFRTAARYMAGLADYLYGVLAREGSADSDSGDTDEANDYQGWK